jgi:hypothetical protein
MNQKELACKSILEELFPNNTFVKIRHPKMRNPDTDKPLELDLYCKELGLAIEYNGPQHYKYIEFYHKDPENFEKQKTRDLLKEGYCDIFAIELISIPNLQKYDEIKSYIIKSLEARGVLCFSVNILTENVQKSAEEIEEVTKTCRVCGIEKPLDDFPVDTRNKDGREGTCKVCRKDKKKKKICNKCGESKVLEDYPIHKATKDGRRGDCKDCYNKTRKNRNLPAVVKEEDANISENMGTKNSTEYDKILLNMTITHQKLSEISYGINSSVYNSIDMTETIKNIKAEYDNMFDELLQEYQKIIKKD